jgi:hypothetical protein
MFENSLNTVRVFLFVLLTLSRIFATSECDFGGGKNLRRWGGGRRNFPAATRSGAI